MLARDSSASWARRRLRQRVDASDRHSQRARRQRPRELADQRHREVAPGEHVDQPEADHRLRSLQQRAGADLALSREALPKTTIRPSGASAASSASKASPPLMWRTASTFLPSLASRIAPRRSSRARVDGRVGAEALDQLALLGARGEPDHLGAPAALAICTASVPVPPAAASITIVSPGLDPRRAA